MRSLENYFCYLKSESLKSLDDAEIEWLKNYQHLQELKLIFQSLIKSDDWEEALLFSIWKQPAHINMGQYFAKIESAKSRSLYHGFDQFKNDQKSCFVYKMNSLHAFLYCLKDMSLVNPTFIIPLLVSAFEGEGAEILIKISQGKKEQYFNSGGSCFQAMGIDTDFEDKNYKSKISKKEAFSIINNNLEIALQCGGQNVWYLDQVSMLLVSKITTLVLDSTQKKSHLSEFIDIANQRFEQKETKQLIIDAEKFVDQLRDKAIFWHYIGLAHKENAHQDKALSAFKKALAIDPNNLRNIKEMASIYYLNNCHKYFIKWIDENWKNLNTENQKSIIDYVNLYWLDFIDPNEHKNIIEVIKTKKSNDISQFYSELAKLNLNVDHIDSKVLTDLLDKKRIDLVKVFIKYIHVICKNVTEEIIALIQYMLDEGLIKFDDVSREVQNVLIEFSARKSLKDTSSQEIINKLQFTFIDLSLWDQELNNAAIVFNQQFGNWPNIMQANNITYRKIELVANSKPNKIKGDGRNGMPVVPSQFVELTGFEGEEFSLDMCLDEKLKELEFRLVYDSDPDGEFVETDEDRKAG